MPIHLPTTLLPASPSIPYLVDDQYVRGGYRAVVDYAARNAIPIASRKAGMLVYIENTNETFTLFSGNLEDWHAVPKIRYQSNGLDNSPGTVLTPGSFGFGGQAVLITDSLDNHRMFSCQVYGIDLPDSPELGQVVVDIHVGDDFVIQKAFSLSTQTEWIRFYDGLVFSDWSKTNNSSNSFQLGNTLQTALTALELDQVDNVADIDKPLSNAAISALSQKVDTNVFNTAIAASAYGIKYVWANAGERNAQTGMSALEQGVQQDSRIVYSYDGNAWIEFYTLDGVHNHDTAYASIDHDHENVYATADHNHNGVYALADHNHGNSPESVSSVPNTVAVRSSNGTITAYDFVIFR